MKLSRAVMLMPLILVGCEKKKEAAPAAQAAAAPATPAPAPPSNTILIGEALAMSGGQAQYGLSGRNAIQIAVDEQNAAGGIKGKKIEVRVYDTQSKPEESASAAKRLVTQDKANVIIGEMTSSNTLAMAPIAQEAKVPMISPTATNPAVTLAGDYVFRACFIDPFQGAAMAKFAHDTLKFKNVAILTDTKSAYSAGLTEAFEKSFTAGGGKVLATEAFAQGDSDFRAQLTKVKKLKPQGLFVPAYYEDVARIANQAKELNFKVVMMGGDGWDSAKLFEVGGKSVEGGYFTNHYSADDPDPKIQDFIKKYKEKYNAAPDGFAVNAYDAAGVVFDAMKRATDLSGPAIRDAMAATKDYPGVSGMITMDENRNPKKAASILEVKGGKFVFKQKINP